MTLWRDFFDPGYLSPDDLEEPVTITIESIEQGVFEDTDEGGEVHAKRSPVVHFKGTQTVWRVNRINEALLEALFGKRAEDAVGHKVTLAAEPNEVKGAFGGLPSIRVVGSPELEKPLTVSIKLPRRRAWERKLIPTAKVHAPLEVVPEPVPEVPTANLQPLDETPEETQFLADTLQPPEPEPTPAALRATAKQIKAIHDAATQTEIVESKYRAILKKYGAARAQELTAPQADLVLADIREYGS